MRGNIVELIKVVRALPVQAISAATVNGANIDTRDAEDMLIELEVSDMGGTSPVVDAKIQHADDNGAGAPGTYADIPSASIPQIVGAADNNIFLIRVNCARFKRWQRIVVTMGGTSPTGQIRASALLGRNAETPVTQTHSLVLDVQGA